MVRNVFIGTLVHIASVMGPLLLAIGPLRWLLAKIVTQPGFGPSKEVEANSVLDARAIAVPEGQPSPRAYGRIRWDGGIYAYTGVLIAEAAATLLYANGESDDVPARQMGGGVLTPACLGGAYWERLGKAGVIAETDMLEE